MKNLIAIKRVQMGPVKKICAKYLGPYKIIKIKLNNSYDMKRAQRKFYEKKYMCQVHKTVVYCTVTIRGKYYTCSGRSNCGNIILLSFIFNIRRKC